MPAAKYVSYVVEVGRFNPPGSTVPATARPSAGSIPAVASVYVVRLVRDESPPRPFTTRVPSLLEQPSVAVIWITRPRHRAGWHLPTVSPAAAGRR